MPARYAPFFHLSIALPILNDCESSSEGDPEKQHGILFEYTIGFDDRRSANASCGCCGCKECFLPRVRSQLSYLLTLLWLTFSETTSQLFLPSAEFPELRCFLHSFAEEAPASRRAGINGETQADVPFSCCAMFMRVLFRCHFSCP